MKLVKDYIELLTKTVNFLRVYDIDREFETFRVEQAENDLREVLDRKVFTAVPERYDEDGPDCQNYGMALFVLSSTGELY